MDLTAQITDRLVAELNGAYARTQYDEFTQGLCYPGRTPTDAATGTCDLGGVTLANAPELKLHAGLAYDRSTCSASSARTDYSWATNTHERQSRSAACAGRVRPVGCPGGLRIGDWDLSIWGENLTDETYVYQSAVTNLFGSDPAYQSWPAPGLSYGVTARIRF
jgi:outer membrane receptor protein involved in Fe transport